MLSPVAGDFPINTHCPLHISVFDENTVVTCHSYPDLIQLHVKQPDSSRWIVERQFDTDGSICAALSPYGGKILASCEGGLSNSNNNVSFWDRESGNLQRRMKLTGSARPCDVVWRSNRRRSEKAEVYVASRAGTVTRATAERDILAESGAQTSQYSVAGGTTVLALASTFLLAAHEYFGRVDFLDLDSLVCVRSIRLGTGAHTLVTGISLSADQRHLLCSCYAPQADAWIKIIDCTTGFEARSLRLATGELDRVSVQFISFLPSSSQTCCLIAWNNLFVGVFDIALGCFRAVMRFNSDRGFQCAVTMPKSGNVLLATMSRNPRDATKRNPGEMQEYQFVL